MTTATEETLWHERETLAGHLVAQQRERDLSDEAFAALLGLTRAEWRELAHERAAWPAATLARALVRFPDALPLATVEVRRRREPGDGWRHWHAASEDSSS